LNEIHTRISTLNLDAIEMRQEADNKRREADNKRREVERTKTRRAQLLKEHTEVLGQVWDTSKETCPTCKQQLPTGDIEAMRNEFNVSKSNRLAELQAAGKEVSKDVIAGLEVEVVSLEAEVTSLDAKVAEIEASIKTTRYEIDGIKTPRPAAYEETAEYKAQMAIIHKLRQERNDLKATTQRGVSEAIAAQEAVIRQLSGELERMQQVKAGQEQAKKLTERIEQLEKQEKELTKNYEKTELGLYWCELFVRAKVSMLTNAINRKFTKVKFRLFKEQINGGLTDDCEVLVPGQGGAFVPWGEGANTGAKINGGLEIIKVLSAHYKTSLPIVCDNAEAVSDWTDVEGVQLIKLVVTRDDETLRVEHE
jgi:chromosome segregation ATPase